MCGCGCDWMRVQGPFGADVTELDMSSRGKEFGVGGQYAHALLAVAKTTGNGQKIAADVEKLGKSLTKECVRSKATRCGR